MGLIKEFLTRAAYNARIEALSKEYPFLAEPASSITVPPGWLEVVEDLLKVINEIGNGEIDFIRIDRKITFDTLIVFIETRLGNDSGRNEAIKHEIEKARSRISDHEVCTYCGVNLHDGESGKCREHSKIVSGWYADEVKYGVVETTEDGDVIERSGVRFIKPDALKLSQDCMQALVTPLQGVNKKGAEQLDVALTYITRMRWWSNDLVQEDEFDKQRAEILDGLAKAFEKEPEPKRPVMVDTTGRAYPTVPMYKLADVEAMWSKSQWRDRKQLIEPYYKVMKEMGPARYLSIVPESWRSDLDLLEQDFPNFGEVIGYLRQQFALSAAGDGRIHFPPLLLAGPAGIGKTYLCKALAGMIRTTYVELHFESEQTSASLTGASAFWSNALPGKIADALVLKEIANPIVVVDELDKATTRGQYDPLAGLYSLLEPATARSFEDMCLTVPIDASAVCWVMTCNETDRIPLPIMSRLKVFQVPAPTIEQVEHIARRIYASLLSGHYGKAFDPELPDDVLEALGMREPRVIRNTLLSALGNAAIESRSTLEVKDLDGTKQKVSGGNYQGSKIGFAKDMK